MRKNLPLFGSCILSLTLLMAMSAPISAQTEIKTIAQAEALHLNRQSANPNSNILNLNNNIPTTVSGHFSEKVSSVDCDQGDDSEGFTNGFNITANSPYRSADDFFVSPNEVLNVRSIVFNVFANYPVSSVIINVFEDDEGKPGETVVESLTGVIP